MTITTTDPFVTHVEQYDRWFENHKYVFESEVEAIKRVLPTKGKGLEIGVNTGRFAHALNIHTGIEFYKEMRNLAQKRVSDVIVGQPYDLPFQSETFDYVLQIDIAYLDNPLMCFKEIHRILNPSGKFILAFILENSPIGNLYQERRNSIFYQDANYYTLAETTTILKDAGFRNLEYTQTIFGNNLQNINTIQIPETGFDKGSFIVIKCEK